MKMADLFEMASLIAVYSKDQTRARLWQKSIGGYDYEIEFSKEYDGQNKKSFTDSIDDVNMWLEKEGFTLVK